MAAILKALSKIRMVNLESLVWSEDEYEVSEFLEEFRLPQIVQVQEGVYESSNEKTMPAGQILKLHAVQQTEKILGETSKGDEIRIPLSCPQKLQIIPDICNDTECASVEELCLLSPKYARALDTLQRPHITKGTVFELKGKAFLSSKWYLELKNMDKPHNRVQIPLLMCARFQPLADFKAYFLVEAISQFSFPFRVKFLDSMGKYDSSFDGFSSQERRVDLPSQGVITLHDRREESIVISTSRCGRNVTVVTFPTDLSITFSPALGLLRGDSNYARICKEFHDGVDLEKIKKHDQHNACFSSDTVQQMNIDYEEIAPPVPPRDDSPEPEINESSDDDETDEWSDSGNEDQESDLVASVTPYKGQTKPFPDTPMKSQSQSPPPRPPKPAKALSCSSSNPKVSAKRLDLVSAETHFKPATTNAFFGFKPKLKPKPTTKLFSKTQAIEPDSSASMSSGQNWNPEYTKPAYPTLVPVPQSQTEAFIEDSGIGLESTPVVPMRTSSLQHEIAPGREAPSKREELNSVVSFEGTEAEGIDNVFQSNDDDFVYPSPEFSVSNSRQSSDEDHDYTYIDTDKYSSACQPNIKHTKSQSQSRFRAIFNKYGRKSHSRSLTTLSDLRHVVEEDLLGSLTISQVVDCLKLLHLSGYKKAFKEKQIDGSLFVSLTEQHLTDLGVLNVTDRTKLLKFINEGWVPRR